eukprot:421704_1
MSTSSLYKSRFNSKTKFIKITPKRFKKTLTYLLDRLRTSRKKHSIGIRSLTVLISGVNSHWNQNEQYTINNAHAIYALCQIIDVNDIDMIDKVMYFPRMTLQAMMRLSTDASTLSDADIMKAINAVLSELNNYNGNSNYTLFDDSHIGIEENNDGNSTQHEEEKQECEELSLREKLDKLHIQTKELKFALESSNVPRSQHKQYVESTINYLWNDKNYWYGIINTKTNEDKVLELIKNVSLLYSL